MEPTTVGDKAARAREALAKVKANPQAAVDAWGAEAKTKVQRLKAAAGEGGIASSVVASEAKAGSRASRNASISMMGATPAVEDTEGDEFRAAMDPNRSRGVGYAEKGPDGEALPAKRVPAPYSEDPLDFPTSHIPESPSFFGSPRAYEEPKEEAVRSTIAKYLPPEELIGLSPDSPVYRRAANFMWERERKKAVAANSNITRIDYDPNLRTEQGDRSGVMGSVGGAVRDAGMAAYRGALKAGNAGTAMASSILGEGTLGAVPAAVSAVYPKYGEVTEQAQADAPAASFVGKAAGLMSGKMVPGQLFGAAGAAVPAAGAVAGAAVPRLGAMAASHPVITGLAEGAAAGALGSAGVGAAQDLAAGNPGAAADGAGHRALLGGALGAPLHGLGMLAGAGERAFKGTPSGQRLEQFERAGGRAGATGWNASLHNPPALGALKQRGITGQNIAPTEQAFGEMGQDMARAAYSGQQARLNRLSAEAKSYYASEEGMQELPMTHTANTALDSVLEMKGRPFAHPEAIEAALDKLWDTKLMTAAQASAFSSMPGYRVFSMREAASSGIERAIKRSIHSKPSIRMGADGKMEPMAYVMRPRRVTAGEFSQIEPDLNRFAKAWKEDPNIAREHTSILHSMYRDRSQWKANPGRPERAVEVTNDQGESEVLTGFAAMKKRHQDVLDQAGDTVEEAGLPRTSPGERPGLPGEIRDIRLDPGQTAAFERKFRDYGSRTEGGASVRRDAALEKVAGGGEGLSDGLRMVQAANARAALDAARGPGITANSNFRANVHAGLSAQNLGTGLYPLMRSFARDPNTYKPLVPSPFQSAPGWKHPVTGTSLALRGNPSRIPLLAEDRKKKTR